MEVEASPTGEIELAVTVTVKVGVRHAMVEWLPSNTEAVELAIEVACSHAANGYQFQGIRRDEGGGQQLWLVQQQPPQRADSPVD